MFSSLLHSKGTTKQTDGHLAKEARGQGAGAQRQDFCPHGRQCATPHTHASTSKNLPEPHASETLMEASSQIHDPSLTPPAAPPPSLEDWRGMSESFKLQTMAWPFWCPSPTESPQQNKRQPISKETPRDSAAWGQEPGAETEHPNQDAPSYFCCVGSYKGSRSSATGAGTGLLISQQHRVQQHSDSTRTRDT